MLEIENPASATDAQSEVVETCFGVCLLHFANSRRRREMVQPKRVENDSAKDFSGELLSLSLRRLGIRLTGCGVSAH